jgi:hypothetical protein
MNRRILLPLAAAAAAAAGCAPMDTVAGPQAGAAAERAQATLAERLSGRTAGQPVACVRSQDLRGNTPIDERTILFQGPGDTLYVNRTATACAGIRPWHAIRTRTVGTQMCEGELIVAFDPASGVEYGGCTLGRFEPWRRGGG